MLLALQHEILHDYTLSSRKSDKFVAAASCFFVHHENGTNEHLCSFRAISILTPDDAKSPPAVKRSGYFDALVNIESFLRD